MARALLDRALGLLPEGGPQSTEEAWLAAEVYWGAAQALVESGGPREDARRLAIAARPLFAAQSRPLRELDQIDEFLRRGGATPSRQVAKRLPDKEHLNLSRELREPSR